MCFFFQTDLSANNGTFRVFPRILPSLHSENGTEAVFEQLFSEKKLFDFKANFYRFSLIFIIFWVYTYVIFKSKRNKNNRLVASWYFKVVNYQNFTLANKIGKDCLFEDLSNIFYNFIFSENTLNNNHWGRSPTFG